jgi:S1-C subfamily serine protease
MQPVRLPDKVKNDHNLPGNGGLIVVSVEASGPAEKAGVLMGDVIISLDGKPVTDTHDIQSVLDPDRVGKTIPVRILRGGTPADLSLTVGERPARGE